VEDGTHSDSVSFINSYRFTQALQPFLRPQEIIVTDMGAPLICAHQVLKLKPPQRLMTSGGLGEMGCALPAAIGASFATNKGEVLCLHADGGMMLNLQEMQTIAHHKLPINIIVYENGGYDMIRKTQDNAGMRRVGSDRASGVSCPNYRALAHAFGFSSCEVNTWAEANRAIPQLFSGGGPSLIVYHMDPEQAMVPKLGYKTIDGVTKYAPFNEMSPAHA
jgi:acetolactate synthase-1/2/3 large subunit